MTIKHKTALKTDALGRESASTPTKRRDESTSTKRRDDGGKGGGDEVADRKREESPRFITSNSNYAAVHVYVQSRMSD